MKRRALISVSDKSGITDFARGLEELGYEIISTGGTFQVLQEAGVTVKPVSQVTGFPEILDGRVKTLHPNIHGGILARRIPGHLQELDANQIGLIDVVVVNLYPFKETISHKDVTLEEAIENIDIGGPAMVRAAAKNYRDVVIVVKPEFYNQVLLELQKGGTFNPDLRMRLARVAFSHTATYDLMIAGYLDRITGEQFPEQFMLAGEKVYPLRYGENPHQQACFYRDLMPGSAKGLADAAQLNGKELSYNNIIDAEAAWELAKELPPAACVIIKHTNPCGVAIGERSDLVFEKAFAADPISAFGGVIAFNQAVDLAAARKMAEHFIEVVIAPGYDREALDLLRHKKNLRLLELPLVFSRELQVKSVAGGILVQEKDQIELQQEHLEVVTRAQPTREEMQQLLLAQIIVKHVKSNGIVVARDNVTLGIGAGQMNRVGAARLALVLEQYAGGVMASDAFFPFADTVELAAAKGIKAIIQPGGSIRDEEVIEACNRHGLSMVFTGIRHFKH